MSIKKHAPKMIAFNEKNRKIGIIFDIENWLWKSEIGIFQSINLERTYARWSYVELPKSFWIRLKVTKLLKIC